MGETEPSKGSKDARHGKGNSLNKAFNPSISRFFVQLPHKLQNFVHSRLNVFSKENEGIKLGSNLLREEIGYSTEYEVNLEKQLQAWKENPKWVDQAPEIKVSVPKGSLCNLSVRVNAGLPPDAIYNIVTDPDNKRVFKNIQEVVSREVLIDEGLRQVVELEQAALWKFLWWSGTISVHVLVDQNRADHSMKFKQLKAGFMKRFEGCWRVEPLFVDESVCLPFKPKTWKDYQSCTGGKGRIGSRVTLEQLIQPAIVPPPPISWYLRGITSRTTEMLINDLLAETARIRDGLNPVKLDDKLEASRELFKASNDKTNNIKERWAVHRRLARQRKRRLQQSEDEWH